MSKYKVIKSQLKNRDSLVAALEACSVPYEEGEALPLYGYAGDRRQETAQIVVRRQHVGPGANDLGFTYNPDAGVYNVTISEYDEHGPGMALYKRVKQQYAVAEVYRMANEQGYYVERLQDEAGVVRLQLVR